MSLPDDPHIEIAKVDGRWLLHLEQRRGFGPVMVLELWVTSEHHASGGRWRHVRDIVGPPSTIGIDWDDAAQRPRDPEAALAALMKLLAPPESSSDGSDDDADCEFGDLSEPEQREYMLERAQLIADRTPDGEDWDDPDEWQLDAAELAHAVVRFLEGPTRSAGARLDLGDIERKARAANRGLWASLAADAANAERWADPESEANAQHIAANSPPVTLAMVARIRELEDALHRVAIGWSDAESVDVSAEMELLQKGTVLQ